MIELWLLRMAGYVDRVLLLLLLYLLASKHTQAFTQCTSIQKKTTEAGCQRGTNLLYYAHKLDVQRLAQLAHAAAAAAVRNEQVCMSGHQSAVRRSQAAGQHEFGLLQAASHRCSYWGREIHVAILLRLRAETSHVLR